MRRTRFEFKTDGKDSQHDTDKTQYARQYCADQIDGIIAPGIGYHMSLYGDRLNAVHNYIVRHSFFAEHLALERTGYEIRHRQHLLVRRIASYRISVRHIEIDLRTFERYQIAVKAFADNKNAVNLAFLHRIAGFGIGIGNQLYIHGRSSLHLMNQPAGDGSLVLIDHCHRHLLGRPAFHQGQEEKGG